MARALATIEQLRDVRAHGNADALELATVRGWQVVVKLDEFTAGDTVVYFEIDTMLDINDERFDFLASRGVRTDVRDDFSGHVLRTVKLRGEISQGLVLPVELFPELGDVSEAGRDVTDELGLRKWDPPLPTNLSGKVVGPRPGIVPKTDAERIQNFDVASLPSQGWVATEKIDGTSTSYFMDEDGVFRVATRNLELEPVGQLQWTIAEDLGIAEMLAEIRPDSGVAVLQGELAGIGIQKNPLGLSDRQFFAFRLLVDERDVPTDEWPDALIELAAPVIKVPFPATVEDALIAADALDSVVSPGKRPEGIVWRYEGDELVPERSLKAISNRYLLKHDS